MDIMQSLLSPVWQHEEQRKQSSYREKLDRITRRLFRRIVSPHTPLQKKIIRWCGGNPPELILHNTQSMQSHFNQQNLANMAIAGQQNLTNMQSQQHISSLQNTYNSQNAASVNYQGGNVFIASSNTAGSNQYSLGPSQLTPGQMWYTAPNQISVGSPLVGILFGIEERCGKADIHRYDEDAVYMLDHRMIEREVPILWIASFCLSNRQDPEMAIVALESNGYLVVEGDDD